MEITDERRIQDVPSRDPAPLLRAIALPVHEVLETPAPASNLQQTPDGVRFRTTDKARRRGGFGDRMHGAAQKGLNLRYVEGGVNAAKGEREFETHGSGTDDAGHREGPNEAGGQLAGIGLEGVILGREPHALALAIPWGSRAVTVSLRLHPGRGAKQGGTCVPPRPVAASDECLRRRHAHLSLLVREQRRLIAHGAFERGATSGG